MLVAETSGRYSNMGKLFFYLVGVVQYLAGLPQGRAEGTAVANYSVQELANHFLSASAEGLNAYEVNDTIQKMANLSGILHKIVGSAEDIVNGSVPELGNLSGKAEVLNADEVYDSVQELANLSGKAEVLNADEVNDSVQELANLSGKAEVLNADEVNDSVQELANLLGEKYFLEGTRCLTVITEPGHLRGFRSNNSVIHLEVDSERADCRDVLYRYLRQTFRYKCNGYIMQLKRPECGLLGWWDTYKQKFVPRHNPKYLFLPIYPELRTFGAGLLSLQQTDLSCNILVAEIHQELPSDWSVAISTNNFYEHPTKDGRDPMILLDEWHHERGFTRNADLYPDKIMDLKGKPFRISTIKYLPFTSAEPLDGMENRIAIQFCEMRNCSPVAVEDDKLWGTIYPNYTGDGILGNVYNDSSDLGTSAVYLWLAESYFVDYTAAYLAGDVTVMLPRPTRIGGWLIPFLPFKTDMWCAFFASLFVSALSLYSITRVSIAHTRFGELLKEQFTTIEDSSMRAIGLAVLQMPSSRIIGDSPSRYLFTSFEFLYLVLSAMYSAELASFLTIPLFNSPIDKFHDFAESGIFWLGTHEAWSYALKESPEVDARKVVQHFKILPMDELVEKAKEGKYGFTAERLPGGSITEQEHITEDVIPLYHIMKEPMFGSPLVGALKKGGPYNGHYDALVNKVVEHGLSLFWEADVSRTYLSARIQAEYDQAKSLHVDSSPSVIVLDNIQGILYLYVIGIVLALLVFFYELVRGKNTTTTKHNHHIS